MNADFWQKQGEEPLFPDLIWSRPENKRYAGKLLIIGGKSGEFSHVAAAFEAAQRAGAGHIRVLLPESLRKVAQIIPEVEFAPVNKSGGFARTALAQWFDAAEWADHVLLSGDFGRNSETTTIIDGFLLRGGRPVTLNLNSIASCAVQPEQLLNLPVSLIADRRFLQKAGISLGLHVSLLSTTPIERLSEAIHQISLGRAANLLIQDSAQSWAVSGGNMVSMKTKTIDNTKLSAACAVWTMQNPKKPLEALATAYYDI